MCDFLSKYYFHGDDPRHWSEKDGVSTCISFEAKHCASGGAKTRGATQEVRQGDLSR